MMSFKRASSADTSVSVRTSVSTSDQSLKKQQLPLFSSAANEGTSTSSTSARLPTNLRHHDPSAPPPITAPELTHSSSNCQPVSSSSSQRPAKALTPEQTVRLGEREDPAKDLVALHKMVHESGLENLYAKMQDNTVRTRELSDNIAVHKRDINDLVGFVVNSRMAEKEKLEKYLQMKAIWQKIHALNAAKIKLTQSAYDTVDRVIKRLESKLELIIKEIGVDTGGGEQEKRSRSNGKWGLAAKVNQSAQLDPREPIYCHCKKVAYGEMVACDNAMCLIEWFHFGCVGLSSKPRGKWFCNTCLALTQTTNPAKKKTNHY